MVLQWFIGAKVYMRKRIYTNGNLHGQPFRRKVYMRKRIYTNEIPQANPRIILIRERLPTSAT